MALLKKLRSTYIMALVMMYMGLSLIFGNNPTAGGAPAVITGMLRFPIAWYGILMLVFGLLLLKKHSIYTFLILTAPLALYVVFSVVWLLITPSTPPAYIGIYIGFYLLTLRIFTLYGHITDE